MMQGYAAFNRGDFDTAARDFDPDIELIRAGTETPIKGAHAVRAWMEPNAFESMQVDVLELTVTDDKVLVRQMVRARGSGSGVDITSLMWSVWTCGADGLWVRMEVFLTHEDVEARRAAGLEG